MPAYLIVRIRFLSDPEGFKPYRDAVGPLSERFGGRYLVAGGTKVDVLEGSSDGRSLVVFEFPSMERLRAFWNSPAYAEIKKLRLGVAELDVSAVPGYEPLGSDIAKR